MTPAQELLARCMAEEAVAPIRQMALAWFALAIFAAGALFGGWWYGHGKDEMP